MERILPGRKEDNMDISIFPIHMGLDTAYAVKGDGVIIIVGKTTGSHIPPEVEERETLLWTAEVCDGLVSEWRIYSDEEEVRKSLKD
jgi:hypothetical protein